jgi:death on curing protein
MSEPGWRWIIEAVVLAIHDEQLAEHGGLPGVRDLALVQSALARPQNLAGYGKPDIADLAAAYAYGIARNHGFIDGNKRTAFVVAYVFLLDHGYEITASDPEIVRIMLAVATGDLPDAELAAWLRRNIRPISPA